MNSNLKFLALGLLAGPIVASAQEYDYTGAEMTGTSTVNIYNTTGGFTTTTTPVSEAFSAQFVLSGASLTYTLDLGGGILAAGSANNGGSGPWYLGPGIINATYANGAIKGFGLSINNCCGKINTVIDVGGNFDSYYSGVGNSGAFFITRITSSTPGVWVGPIQTPEIDPASAASGLTLLLGTLLVARGRRPLRLPRSSIFA
jgi:hypothetical protein